MTERKKIFIKRRREGKTMREREREKKRKEKEEFCVQPFVLKVSLCPCHILSFNLSHLTFNVFPSDRKLFEKSGHQILSHRYTLVPILLLNSYFQQIYIYTWLVGEFVLTFAKMFLYLFQDTLNPQYSTSLCLLLY